MFMQPFEKLFYSHTRFDGCFCDICRTRRGKKTFHIEQAASNFARTKVFSALRPSEWLERRRFVNFSFLLSIISGGVRLSIRGSEKESEPKGSRKTFQTDLCRLYLDSSARQGTSINRKAKTFAKAAFAVWIGKKLCQRVRGKRSSHGGSDFGLSNWICICRRRTMAKFSYSTLIIHRKRELLKATATLPRLLTLNPKRHFDVIYETQGKGWAGEAGEMFTTFFEMFAFKFKFKDTWSGTGEAFLIFILPSNPHDGFKIFVAFSGLFLLVCYTTNSPKRIFEELQEFKWKEKFRFGLRQFNARNIKKGRKSQGDDNEGLEDLNGWWADWVGLIGDNKNAGMGSTKVD